MIPPTNLILEEFLNQYTPDRIAGLSCGPGFKTRFWQALPDKDAMSQWSPLMEFDTEMVPFTATAWGEELHLLIDARTEAEKPAPVEQAAA